MMTEDEWLHSANSSQLLDSLAGNTSSRKLRLFACACVRHVWHLLSDERSRHAVVVAERFADGLVNLKELINARDEAREAKQQFKWPVGPPTAFRAAGAAQDAVRDSDRGAARNCASETARALSEQDTNYCDAGELAHQLILLRDIFGNPFRLVIVDPSWLAPAVVGLASYIYEERAFERMPDLVSVLEARGCKDRSILQHCRQREEHVQGCWVVDLLLGKE